MTAELIWIALREAGRKVAAATFPGADGLDIRIPGLANSPIVQRAAERTVDYTVPFGAFAGIGAQGFSLVAANFSPAPASTVNQLMQAGRTFWSPVLQKTTSLETFTVGGVAYDIRVAALDTTNDAQVNYDTLVFFDARQGILPGPFALPSTGPAYVRASDKRSAPFYLEGSSSKAGVGFYVSQLSPDLSTVRIARYSANSIPRNPAVLGDVDDINTRVGFWAPQPDFRIPERLSPGFGPFPDIELEAMYADLVHTFVDYQTRVALRAIERLPNADLLMLYIEQPDGSGHQFLLEDPRQPSDFTNPASIGAGQDAAKIARYRAYRETAYKVASRAVQRIVEAVGTDAGGRPKSNIIVVSDHGFETFHTAVNMPAFLASRGFDPAKVRAVTSGPAANVYINLQGREPNGTVGRDEYLLLQEQIASALGALVDANPNYTNGAASIPVFDKVYRRPVPADIADPSFGRGTSEFIGQDSGDVSALLTVGYNFDGTQSPVVQRLGDAPATSPTLSLPNFYGAHGYDPLLPNMSAIFIAAGPDIRPGSLTRVRNIDIAPTIGRLLGVKLCEPRRWLGAARPHPATRADRADRRPAAALAHGRQEARRPDRQGRAQPGARPRRAAVGRRRASDGSGTARVPGSAQCGLRAVHGHRLIERDRGARRDRRHGRGAGGDRHRRSGCRGRRCHEARAGEGPHGRCVDGDRRRSLRGRRAFLPSGLGLRGPRGRSARHGTLTGALPGRSLVGLMTDFRSQRSLDDLARPPGSSAATNRRSFKVRLRQASRRPATCESPTWTARNYLEGPARRPPRRLIPVPPNGWRPGRRWCTGDPASPTRRRTRNTSARMDCACRSGGSSPPARYTAVPGACRHTCFPWRVVRSRA